MNEYILQSESGKFICDESYIVQHFEPYEGNIIGEKHYKHLIIPEGIIGFCGGFGSWITVNGKFVLPESILEIGNVLNKREAVFSYSKLSTIIIPESVNDIGVWAFGASEIDVLCLPMFYGRKFPHYARQFKDAKINTLYVHKYKLESKDVYGYARIDSYSINKVYYYRTKENGCLPTSLVCLTEKQHY